jgi:hypothetical protein
MHSSPDDAFGRSGAGLDFLSDDRAAAVQRMRALSRAQHVVSTIIFGVLTLAPVAIST